MRYYLDCKFNGLCDELISMAMVRQDGVSMYVISFLNHGPLDPWVEANVLPAAYTQPIDLPVQIAVNSEGGYASHIAKFLDGDPDPVIIADWPDDIRYFCEEAITGPGTMIDVPGLKFEVVRIDPYDVVAPELIPDAVRHNAYWDAVVLRMAVMAQRGEA